MLRSDLQFRAFHQGRSEVLPSFYHKEYERMLGPYAELLSWADRTPNLALPNPLRTGGVCLPDRPLSPAGVQLSGSV